MTHKLSLQCSILLFGERLGNELLMREIYFALMDVQTVHVA